MSLSKADQKLLEVYKGEFKPPGTWTMDDARAYREQLNGLKQKKSQLARYAPIGQMAFVDAEIVSIGPQIQKFKQTLSTTRKEEDRKPLQERIETLQRRLKKLKEDAPNMPPDSSPFITC